MNSRTKKTLFPYSLLVALGVVLAPALQSCVFISNEALYSSDITEKTPSENSSSLPKQIIINPSPLQPQLQPQQPRLGFNPSKRLTPIEKPAKKETPKHKKETQEEEEQSIYETLRGSELLTQSEQTFKYLNKSTQDLAAK